jgi:hypothetical protein
MKYATMYVYLVCAYTLLLAVAFTVRRIRQCALTLGTWAMSLGRSTQRAGGRSLAKSAIIHKVLEAGRGEASDLILGLLVVRLLGKSADKHIDELFRDYTELFPMMLAEMTLTKLSQLGGENNIQCESPELGENPVCVADPLWRTQLLDLSSQGTASLLTVPHSAQHTLVCIVKWQVDEALFVIMETHHLDDFRHVLGLPEGRLNPNQSWMPLYNLRGVTLTPGMEDTATLRSLLHILEMRTHMKSTYLKVSRLHTA